MIYFFKHKYRKDNFFVNSYSGKIYVKNGFAIAEKPSDFHHLRNRGFIEVKRVLKNGEAQFISNEDIGNYEILKPIDEVMKFPKKKFRLYIKFNGALGDTLIILQILLYFLEKLKNVSFIFHQKFPELEAKFSKSRLRFSNECKNYDLISNLENPSFKGSLIKIYSNFLTNSDIKIRFGKRSLKKSDKEYILFSPFSNSMTRTIEKSAIKRILSIIYKKRKIAYLVGDRKFEFWSLKGIKNLTGKTSLKTIFSLIEKCKLLISTDNGLVHYAGMKGVPTIAYFNEQRSKDIISHYQSVKGVQSDLDCSPCYSICRNNYQCLKKTEKFEKIIKETI